MIRTSSPRCAGFSLIEMLVVVAVLMALLALIAPAFNSIGNASNLTNATALVQDELNFARQTAVAKNRPAEVRFYLLRHEVDPTLAYRAMRTFVADETGKQMFAVDSLKRLPAGIVALRDDQFSTLLSDTMRTHKSEEVENLPNAPATLYKPVRFRSNGGAELTSYTTNNDTWFLTLKNENQTGDAQKPAANFATIQLDPTTGRARQFRP